MKKILFLSLFVSMVLVVSAGEKYKLTLEQAKAYALEQNPTLAMARANIAAAAAALKAAHAAYMPTVDLTGQFARLRDNTNTKSRGYSKDWDNQDQYNTELTASWLLFDGGARRFSQLIATYGNDIAIENCEDAKRTLLESVSYAFYSVIRSQNAMEIALKDAEFNRVLHQDSKTRLENGVAKPSEVLNFEFQVGQAEVNFIEAEQNWRSNCVALGRLLVIGQDKIWEMIELVKPQPALLKNKEKLDISSELAHAKSHRPDYLAAQHEVAQAEAQVKRASSDYLPKVNLFYDIEFEREHSAHFNRNYDRNITFGAALQWNLFNGYGTQAQCESAQAELERTKKALESLEQQIDAEVRQNCIALESSRRTLDKQNRQLEIAKKIRDLVKEEYDGGTATITRLNEVQTDLTNAALAQSIAYIAVLTNLENLRSSTGDNLAEEIHK